MAHHTFSNSNPLSFEQFSIFFDLMEVDDAEYKIYSAICPGGLDGPARQALCNLRTGELNENKPKGVFIERKITLCFSATSFFYFGRLLWQGQEG